MEQPVRILAVDPGQKRIGLAVSDPTATIASPLTVIRHISLVIDSAQIAQIALEQGAVQIVIGQPLSADGGPTPGSRHANRLAEAIRAQFKGEVLMWDESGSTLEARQARISMGVQHQKRTGHMDDLAAVVILQSYLDSRVKTL